MKASFKAPAVFAFVTLGASMFAAGYAGAHQTVQRSYSYPNGTGGGYSQARATCNTGWPDFDSDCTNGNNISVKWFAKTTAQAQVDIEYGTPFSVNLSPGAHWWCNATLYCSDGSTPSYTYIDVPCGWTTCPSGRYATSVQVSFGIDNNPS